MKELKKSTFRLYRGFTLVELILVVFIMAIAALVAVPMFSSAADIQVRSTANRIAADLDYARGLAITRQKDFWIVFDDSAAESYALWWHNPTSSANEIFTNPLTNTPFTVDLVNDSRVGGINIVSTTFTDDTITFDYLGTPWSGGARLNAEGVITLRSRDGSYVLTVKVEPMTGYVTIE
jgi:prepilin-type N-terminal cleavage/methylation domain-containing protein